MSIGPYQEPEWAVRPTSSIPWTLTEIKGGVEVAQHDLSSRATTVLGRAVDMVHIPLHHQSISRQHARIAFDSSGTPWLRDLQSAHGTFVNKKRLPPKATGKIESNSHQKGARGIVLFVGDVIQMGASSRYFSLEGPPLEVVSEKEQHLAKLNEAVSATANPATSSSAPTDEGISWGMDMGGNDIGDEEGPTATSNQSIELDPSKIPEKYRKELDKINALKYKLANLETEDGRIRRKGGSELTDGQQRQLDRNAEKEAALRKSIQEREERLHDKLNPSRVDGKRRRATMETNYEDEDDDFFDRTKNDNTANDIASEEAESEETLTLKWKKHVGERNHTSTKLLAKANNRVQTLRNELKAMQATGNEEAFFVQNDLQLAVESEKKMEVSLVKINTSLDEIEKLLKVVNPKLNCDRQLGYIGQGSPPPPQPTTRVESQSNAQAFPMPAPRLAQTTAPVSMGPPAPLQSAKPENSTMPPLSPSMQRGPQPMPSTMDPHPNKRKRIIGPAAVPPSKSSPEDIRKPSKAPPSGTLSFLNFSTTTSKAVNDPNTHHAESKSSIASKERLPKPYLKASVDASKMDVWKAPADQDGSGKTKLNEKFAGRY